MLEMLRERKAALEAQGKKGFTLMEMLIVIAIIAILIAIAIPVFTAQLERAGEATDAANIRAKYAEVLADYIMDSKLNMTDLTVDLQQGQEGWQNEDIEKGLKSLATESGGTNGLQVEFTGSPKAHGKAIFSLAEGTSTTPAKMTVALQ